jgi:3-deoxy-manno-octulosonate cytidylyltransferase (CMP-KDO synthetase)
MRADLHKVPHFNAQSLRRAIASGRLRRRRRKEMLTIAPCSTTIPPGSSHGFATERTLPYVTVVIPARWASSRFPGKVLAPLGGKPLVIRVCDVAARARRVSRVVVASDDERVLSVAANAGFDAVSTRPDHPSGTDRVAEVARNGEAQVVIGLQADEPFLAPEDLDALADGLAADETAALATLAAPLAGRSAWLDPNATKVVTDGRGRALYFSRSPIPYVRPASGAMPFPPEGEPPASVRLHVGVYGWRRDALLAFTALPPSPLERAEGLEQLRALEAGWTIRVLDARGEPFGVDTPADLARAEERLARLREVR